MQNQFCLRLELLEVNLCNFNQSWTNQIKISELDAVPKADHIIGWNYLKVNLCNFNQSWTKQIKISELDAVPKVDHIIVLHTVYL